MRETLRKVRQLQTHFGSRWLVYRMAHTLRMRSGLIRYQLPIVDWQVRSFNSLLNSPELSDPATYLQHRRSDNAPSFFIEREDKATFRPILTSYDTPSKTPSLTAEQLHLGQITYFSKRIASLGNPPQWHHNPFNEQSLPPDPHWSQLSDFSYGDIKIIWEPSRFSWVYPLVRAYWRTGDEKHPALFWTWVEDWIQENRPNQGANWKCGQETSLRIMALCFGLYGFLHSESTTGVRLLSLLRLMAFSAERIVANLSYALSQRNNHGISEGMGLWTIGLLFPELKGAKRWREKGRSILESEANRLIYADGTFSQHSVNYHRVMLDDFVWSLQLGEVNDQRLSTNLYRQVAQATNWLYQILDVKSGLVPIIGQNDGALILPLSNADYLDFRPIVQAAHYLTTRQRILPAGEWDEKLLWIFGETSLNAPRVDVRQDDFSAIEGGYNTLRDTHSMVFTHCGTFRDRPAHADLLHVDIWWHGNNIAQDSGTFSYNAPAPWNNPLAHTAYHNTVTVNGQDQMQRVSKFLWLPWVSGEVCVQNNGYWEGTHNGYESHHVTYRRGIVKLGDDSWLIVDRLLSLEPFASRLHWLLADLPYEWDEQGQLILQTDKGVFYVTLGSNGQVNSELVRADTNSPRGWRASYYGDREAGLSLSVEATSSQQIFWTLFSALPTQVELDQTKLTLSSPDTVHKFTLSLDDQQFIITERNRYENLTDPSSFRLT